MRKELIIAIISGILIGVIVAFGFWRANTALKTESTDSQDESASSQKQEQAMDRTQLTIAQPEGNDVIIESPIMVSGIAKPETTLIISGENEDYIVKTSSDGSFEQEVDLAGGVNDIILAYSEKENEIQNKTLRVVYSTEFEENTSE